MSSRKLSYLAGYTSLNRVKLLRGGKPYFDCLLSLIQQAQENIHLQTYIYDNDETGKMVADALKAAAQRNVKVYLLADGYASGALPQAFINELRDAGIHFRFFNPLLKSRNFYFGRRLHQKVFVADGKRAMVGGSNITNRYNDLPDHPAWLDFAIYIEGEAAFELCEQCWKTWKNYPSKLVSAPCGEKSIPAINADERSEVAVRRNDWVRRKNEISATYVGMFRSAKSRITILCSYFLPGRMIRRQISYAARNGIKITLITAGVSDVKIAKYAERYMYGWLLRNNVELYEYLPNVLHGKIAVCDGEWMTIGSYNINNISAYASIELNINVKDSGFAQTTEDALLQIAAKDCIRITPEYYVHTRNLFKQFIRWLSYEFIRGAFYLFTFYFKRKHLKGQTD